MHDPPRILVVDDNEANLDIAKMRLESQGYDVITAEDGEAALVRVAEMAPDLLLLDIMMPKLDGIEVTRRLKADPALPFIPVILLTAKADSKDVVAGLDAGGDDYLIKPFDHAALVARVRSMLRIKALHDQVQEQATELDAWNKELEERVSAQIREIERIGRLKRFLAPQIAEMIISSGDESILESHRRDIVVLFCDMRGFTAFAETAEPEDVMAVLRDEGPLDRFAGDGMMVLFNDPVPCPDPAARAVRLAVAMREAVAALSVRWARRGHRIGFGVGIAQGYATIGRIGFEGRSDYSAIGTVANLAARLCSEAQGGQILVSERVAAAVEDIAALEPIGEVQLKGLARPVVARNVHRLLE